MYLSTTKGHKVDDDFYDDIDDGSHDSWVLECAGWGTDEDYGFFGADRDDC